MRALIAFFLLFNSILSANDKTESAVNEFLKKLDGNFRERKEASKQLKNLPPEFYPYLEKHLKQQNISMEVKLRLTKETMFPLKAKWLHIKRMDWYQKNIVEAYEKFGNKNPKWDKEVKKAFELILKQFDEYWIVESYSEQISAACQKAMNKGCKDPLILYFFARANVNKLFDYRKLQLKNQHITALNALKNSKYHDYFKFRSTRLAAYYVRFTENQHYHPKPEDKKRCIDLMMESLTYFEKTIQDPEFPFTEFMNNSAQICTVFAEGGLTIIEGFNRIKPYIAKQYGEDSIEVLCVEGLAILDHALMLRKKDYEEGEKANAEALRILEEAWKKDPANIDIAVKILVNIRNKSNRQEFEKWYNNVLLAEPDNFDAYTSKMDFIDNSGTLDDYWAYADEICNRGGMMIRNLPGIMWKLSAKISTGDPAKLFDFDVLYKNQKFKAMIDKGFSKLISEYPENKNIIMEYANSLGAMYFWKEAHEQFVKGGDINRYTGALPMVVLRQRKKEASMYANGVKEPIPYFIDFEKRYKAVYDENLAGNNYNLWKDYQSQNEPNEKWDGQIKELLKLRERILAGEPALRNDDITKYHKPYQLGDKLRKEGNRDPLIYLIYAEVKDVWFRDQSPHYYLAAKDIAMSKYPNKIKLHAACMGIYYLSQHKNVSDEIKKDVLQLCQRLPSFIGSENYIWTEQYYYLFSGLSGLNLLSEEIAAPLIKAYSKLGKKDLAFMVESHVNNRLAWYTHKQSKKKDWKKINEYNRKSQQALDKAWEINPHDSNIAQNQFIKSDRFKKDFAIKLQRSLYTLFQNYKVMKDYMSQSKNAHSNSLSWAEFPYPAANFQLLHYDHTEMDAKYNKNAREEHWEDISRLFEQHLSKFPNDTVARSKYAQFAIHCNKTEVIKYQLKNLGEHAIPWALGGMAKLKEYREKYLTE